MNISVLSTLSIILKSDRRSTSDRVHLAQVIVHKHVTSRICVFSSHLHGEALDGDGWMNRRYGWGCVKGCTGVVMRG